MHISENTFLKNSNGTIVGGDFYSGHVEVIKGSGFVNSRSSRDMSEISERLARDSNGSQRFFIEICQTLFRWSSMCELL
jgi:hypothetical protein